MLTFYWYPKCSTCRKAKSWLDESQLTYETVDMITTPPTAETLLHWMETNDLPIRRFFNTSGMRYRELGLKDQIDTFTKEEAAALLSTDGMLIKRPILDHQGTVVFGAQEADYQAVIELVNKEK